MDDRVRQKKIPSQPRVWFVEAKKSYVKQWVHVTISVVGHSQVRTILSHVTSQVLWKKSTYDFPPHRNIKYLLFGVTQNDLIEKRMTKTFSHKNYDAKN